eukprot:TRINITY_DN10250_c0_g1_i2.p1 TRINITY_DN10250_c0_g1~~TRINITY_DN10250_c0_g1_i2.p1  ORF type:complete len:128 (+),score=20.99 TRINITY_DN10250_c0_g1_i2:79-462(+)
MNTFDLPPEIWSMVIKSLQKRDIFELCLVNTQMREIALGCSLKKITLNQHSKVVENLGTNMARLITYFADRFSFVEEFAFQFPSVQDANEILQEMIERFPYLKKVEYFNPSINTYETCEMVSLRSYN